jgi:hypothetical protein
MIHKIKLRNLNFKDFLQIFRNFFRWGISGLEMKFELFNFFYLKRYLNLNN